MTQLLEVRAVSKSFGVKVIDDLSVAGPLIEAGIPVATMGMKAGVPDPRGPLRLARHLRRLEPDVVQTWMDHSNLVGTVAAAACPRARAIRSRTARFTSSSLSQARW